MDDIRGDEETRSLIVAMAGMGISFFFDDTLPPQGGEEGRGCVSENTSKTIRLRVRRGPPPERGETEKVFDSGRTWAICKSDGRYVLQDDTLGRPSAPETFLFLDPNLASGEVYLTRDDSRLNPLHDPLGYPLNQILMILLLSKGEGLLVHACGIEDRGVGYLFLGNSTHGKSTMASLWSRNQATVLNDDRVIVREQADSFWMYGTPWHGDFRPFSRSGLPVSKIFFLRHGTTHSVIPKKGADAVSMILVRSFPPLWDKSGMAFTVDLCHRLVTAIPCFELHFKPEESIIDFVRSLD
jgi:hypothetical protein